eukprot:351442-Chlamydomonas_euryale.AAC.7
MMRRCGEAGGCARRVPTKLVLILRTAVPATRVILSCPGLNGMTRVPMPLHVMSLAPHVQVFKRALSFLRPCQP